MFNKVWKAMLVVWAMAGCLEPSLVLCADGLACPVGARCDELHHTCVLPEQLAVCQGVVDGEGCTTGQISGACFGGVCLQRGCGNRVIEAGEMCDDGNQIAGDGCSGDCSSTEVCGNGVRDPGEACDDGSLISHDGCDSRCNLEDAAWTVIAISPDSLNGAYCAYDPVRRRLVCGAEAKTWEWDRTRWSLVATSLRPMALFYDPDRQQVEMLGIEMNVDPNQTSAMLQVYSWANGQWTQLSSGAGPTNVQAISIPVAYDVERHRLMLLQTVMDETSVWTMDSTNSWRRLPSPPGVIGSGVAAFDAASGQVVIEAFDSIEWIYDGSEWTSAAMSFMGTVALVFDPARGHLILIEADSHATYERIGAEWKAVDNGAVPCDELGLAPVYYEPGITALELINFDATEICRWDGSWSLLASPLPFEPVGATYDPVTNRFVIFHVSYLIDPAARIESWALSDDGWQRIETPGAPLGPVNPLTAYSPGRRATVMYGVPPRADLDGGAVQASCAPPCEILADTWSFDGSAWAPIASFSNAGSRFRPDAATYDPAHGRVVVAAGPELWGLGDTDQAWTLLGTPPSSGFVRALAFDARPGDLLANKINDDSHAPLFELRDGGWVSVDDSPGIYYVSSPLALVSDQRAGGVIVIEREHGTVWQRVSTGWAQLPMMPLPPLITGSTAYNPVDGSILFVGRSQSSQGVLSAILKRSSAIGFESCHAGDDIDGDGLAGCDDPDCYWTCSRCLPYTTCL